MSQTSPSTLQPSSPPAAQQIGQREWQTKLLRYVVAALIVVIIFAGAPWIIAIITSLRSLNTTSSNPTAAVTAGRLQDLANRADQQLQQANGLLNLMTSFATVMAVVLAVFAVITVGLGALGFFTNNGFKELEEKWSKNLGDLGEKWSKSLDELEKTLRQKQQDIDKLQEETRQKQQDIDDLQRRLESLKEEMEHEVVDVRTRLENTSRALTFLILGNKLLEDGRSKEAIENFEKAQQLRPDDPQINYTLGRAYSGAGAYDKAIDHLSMAIKADQNFPQAHMELGLAYRRRGNKLYEEAVLEKDQEKSRELRSRAQAEYQRAIEHFTRAIDLRHDYEDALATLGGLYRRSGDYEHNPADYQKALDSYKRASEVEPNSSYALGNLASLLWYFGRQQDALPNFARTQQIAQERIAKLVRPDEVYWDYYDLALAQLALGDIEQAKKTYAIAIEKTPGPVQFDGVLSNLYLLQKAGKPIEGLNEIVKMVEDANARQSKK